jgi:ATP/maltotriose-dependent transcriptional regulator MalT
MPLVRPATIVRDRVTRLLATGGDCRLVVVCAPAGYGARTALITWLAARAQPR